MGAPPELLRKTTALPLPRAFYDRPTLRVARELLGCRLVHETDDGRTSGIIVEVEAYLGPRDRGAHTFAGRRTERNETMWGDPGRAYVYFTYGMHFCLNAVTRPAGMPQAVLIRALEPREGIELMRRRRGLRDQVPDAHVARGPANLCRALGIDRDLDGADLRRSRLRIFPDRSFRPHEILRTPRIGIDYAGEYVTRPWRFLVRRHESVSAPPRTLRATSAT